MNIAQLNQEYQKLSPIERIKRVYQDFDKVLVTSSFGTTSVFLMHLIHHIHHEQVIHFLDTGYHFPETHEYKEVISTMLDMKVESIHPETWKHEFTQTDHTWETDPDLCCSVNKVEPLEAVKPQYQVWVTGLMRFRNEELGVSGVFEEKDGLVKCYPLIDLPKEAVLSWIDLHGLPQHPLLRKGYQSIGCTHCTVPGEGRSGRWAGKVKTECGLHL
ncbi:MAG: phosphoadenylyl-sulfate reductase [Bacteroidia bacterium]|nr:phosphoadenylyl-sulfate reductase [Bacteroidia bacterium]